MQSKLKMVGARAIKAVATVGIVGTLALAAATPSQARHHGRFVGAGVGFAAGALIGSAAAGAAYGPAYGYGPGYAHDAYAYEPGGYVYEPGYVYDRGPYGTFPSDCASDLGYGRIDYSACY